MGIVGCILGAGCSLLVPNPYISTAVVRIIPTDKAGASDAAQWLQQAATTLLGDQSLSELVQRPNLNLYAKQRSAAPLEEVLRKVREHDLKLRLTRPGKTPPGTTEGTTAMIITFEYPDRNKAQALVQAVALQLIEQNREVRGTLTLPTSIDVLDSASLPNSPVFPNRIIISAIGFASSSLLGLISLWASRRRQVLALA